MKDASNPMSCRGVNLLRNSLLALALCLAVTSAAQAGSLDEFNTALGQIDRIAYFRLMALP